jgi:hypothetical protein
MNRPELYKKTVDILFDAYFNDTLRHNNCMACAVGNIVAAGMGYEYDGYIWRGHIDFDYFRAVKMGEVTELGLAQVISTGYCVDELDRIESAFEGVYWETSEISGEGLMLNGLVAVLDALKRIHEIEDNEEEVTRFRNHYATLVK